jgi:multisubunit Na+/H+ antiporter MnhE subunit
MTAMPNLIAIRRYVLQWVALLTLWLLFVFQCSVKEILVGAVASAFIVAFLKISLSAVPLCFAPRARWLAESRHLPAMIAKDLYTLTNDLTRRIMGKRLRSGYELVVFAASEAGPRASAQRALVLLFLTMSPNSIVLGIDEKSGMMFLHHLAPKPLPEIVRNLQT